MKVEMYNSATITAPGRLFDPSRSWARVGLSVRYGVFEHPVLGLTLIDTGLWGAVFWFRRAEVVWAVVIHADFSGQTPPGGAGSEGSGEKGLRTGRRKNHHRQPPACRSYQRVKELCECSVHWVSSCFGNHQKCWLESSDEPRNIP